MKYGLLQRLRYLLNYSRAVVHLQADLNMLPALSAAPPFTIKELSADDENDLKRWLEVVRDAYDEPDHDLNYAVNHINNHLFLNIQNVYLVFDDDLAIGTISIGTYKNNHTIGGDARIAIKKIHQGRGLGTFLILFGFHKLREKGIRYGESIISITRDQSILLHFKCGFAPQTDRRYIQYKGQKRSFIIRWIVNNKVRKMYKNFLGDFPQKIWAGDDETI